MVYPRQCLTERFVQVIVKYIDRFIQVTDTHRGFFKSLSNIMTGLSKRQDTVTQRGLPQLVKHIVRLIYPRHCHIERSVQVKHIDWFIQDTVTQQACPSQNNIDWFIQDTVSLTQMSHREVCPRHTPNTFVTLAGLSQTLSHREACPRHTEGLKHIGCQVYSRHSHTKMLVQVLVKHIGWFIQDTVTQGLLPKPQSDTLAGLYTCPTYRCEKKRCSRLFLPRLINIDNYSAFSIFKPSSNLFVLKKRIYIFFSYICV